jgi:uncharacterized delta-60 repeat protein
MGSLSVQRVLLITAVLLVGLVAAQPASAHPGDLDPTFSTDGLTQFAMGRPAAEGESTGGPVVNPVGFEPDGDVIVAGSISYQSGCTHIGCASSHPYLLMARVQPDGTLDPGFGVGGVVQFDAGDGGGFGYGYSGAIYAVAADGSIVVTTRAGGRLIVVRRFTPTGALDSSFGDGGAVQINSEESRWIDAIAIDDQDRVVLGGHTVGDGPFSWDQLLIRLLPNGALDSSFSADGIERTSVDGDDAVAYLAFDDQHRIVVAGTTATAQPFGNDLEVGRFTEDGEPDPTFGTDGRVRLDLLPDRNSNEEPIGFGVAPGGRPVALVSSFPDTTAPGEFLTVDLLRFTASGDLDGSFGEGGMRTVDAFGQGGGTMTVQPDGSILLAGGVGRGLRVGRVLPDGAFDGEFGQGGWVVTYPRTGGGQSTPVVADDGRVVLGGPTYETPRRVQVARYRVDDQGPSDLDADGVPDPKDRCPGVYWPEDGCPSDSVEVGLKWRDDSIGGPISSTSSYCLATDVLVFKRRHGPDELVRRWRHDDSALHEPFHSPAQSGWGTSRPAGQGLFYAEIKPHFDPTVGECGGARSAVVSVPTPASVSQPVRVSMHAASSPDEASYIFVKGTEGDDNLRLLERGQDVTVRSARHVVSSRCQKVSRTAVRCPASGFSEIDADLGRGNDKLGVARAGGARSVRVDAGRGHDVVTTGDGNDDVHGGPGDDRLTTKGGYDVVGGDEGSDALFAGQGIDVVYSHVLGETEAAPNQVIDCGTGSDHAGVTRRDPDPRGCEDLSYGQYGRR